MLQQPTWFSEEQYYADKLTQLTAMGYSMTLDQVKEAVNATGGAWAHYNLFGYKESYVENGMVKYLNLKDNTGAVVFDIQAYCTSKMAQLKSINHEMADKIATWQDMAQVIIAAQMNPYEHYYSFGQTEGLVLNANFNSGKFFAAKLAILQADSDRWGDWDMAKLVGFFTSNGMDAYSNWLEYGAAEGITLAQVQDTNDTTGIVHELTLAQDKLTGGNGRDYFYAPAIGEKSTLQTGDRIDGGAGVDTLYAELNPSTTVLMPTTNSVEIVKFEVLHEGNRNADNNVKGMVRATNMVGVQEFWSTGSRDDLSIEAVQINSNTVTVGFQSSDPGAVDYELYFQAPYLKSNETTTSGDLILRLIDTTGEKDEDKPLRDNNYVSVTFKYNGTEYTVEFGTVNGSASYEDLKNAIESKVNETAGLSGVSVEMGNQFLSYDGNTGTPVYGTEIVLSSSTGSFEGVKWDTQGGMPPTNSVNATMLNPQATDCPLIQTNIALDNVAQVQWDDASPCLPDNAIYGSTSGDMIVGSMATRGGVERFDVTVDRGSWLNSLSSTNNALRLITVKAADWNNDGVANDGVKNGQLFIGAHLKDHTYEDMDDQGQNPYGDNWANMVNWQDRARVLSHTSLVQTGTRQVWQETAPGSGIWGYADVAVYTTARAGIWDVKQFDASTYTGDINIAAQFTAETLDKYLEGDDGQQLVANAPTGDFAYTFGSGNDTLNMLVIGGVAADRDFVQKINMGDGNDYVNYNFNFSTGNQVIDQVDLKNVSIDTGAGNDTVWAWGKGELFAAGGNFTNSPLGFDMRTFEGDQRGADWQGASGYLKIDAGEGNDAVYAAQDASIYNATWVANANIFSPTSTDPLRVEFTAVGQAQPINNNITSTTSSYTITAGVAAGVYTTFVVIDFLGIEVQAQIGTTYTVGTGGTSYSIAVEDVNKAIIKAIEDSPVMSKLLSAFDGAGRSLLIQSIIEGNFTDDLSISFYHTTSATTPVTTHFTITDFLQFAHSPDVTTAVNWFTEQNTATWNATLANSTAYAAVVTYDTEVVTYTYTTAATGDTWAEVLAGLIASDAAYAHRGYTLAMNNGVLTVTAKNQTLTGANALTMTTAGSGTVVTPVHAETNGVEQYGRTQMAVEQTVIMWDSFAAADVHSIVVNGTTYTSATNTATNWAGVLTNMIASNAAAYAAGGYTIAIDNNGVVTVTQNAATVTSADSLVVTVGGTSTATLLHTVPAHSDINITWTDNTVENVTGTDYHYYGMTEVNGGGGDDVLVTGYTDSIVNAGAGNDTVIVGNATFNKITGGTGADTIILGEFTNGTKAANGVAQYDQVFQGLGDSGLVSAASTNTAKEYITTNTFDVIHNVDRGTAATGDRLVLSSYIGTGTSNLNFTVAAAVSTYDALTASANQDNQVRFAHGTYDDLTGRFTFGAGNDLIIAYDANGATGTGNISWEAVVVTGVGAAATVVGTDAAHATNADYLTIA